MINKSVWKEIALVLVFFGAVWALVIYYSEDEDETWKSWNSEMESSLGQTLLSDYNFNQNLILVWDENNPNLSWDRIARDLDFKSLKVNQVYILKSNEVNAYTLPGSNILICLPLIEFIETPEEFAAVLTHELGHIHHEHIMEMIFQQFAFNTLIAIISGSGGTGVLELSQMLFTSSFSRDNEREADEFALTYLDSLGYGTGGLAQFFTKLHVEQNEMPEWMSALSSHPMNQERIEFANNFRKKNLNSTSLNLDWLEFQKEMKELVDRSNQ